MTEADTRTVAQRVREEGAAVWRGFVPPERVGRLREEGLALAAGPHGRRYPKSTRVWDLYRHGPQFAELPLDPRLEALMADLLGHHHLLSDLSLNIVHPEQPGDDWHVDYPYNEAHGRLASSAPLGVQSVLALAPFTAESGATEYLPGDPAAPLASLPVDPPEPVRFTAEPGDLLVLAASTWHRSGVNRSGGPRPALLLSFVPRWVRPMSTPPEPGPWAPTRRSRVLLGIDRPDETINGVPL